MLVTRGIGYQLVPSPKDGLVFYEELVSLTCSSAACGLQIVFSVEMCAFLEMSL